jgi:hypothetical protein
MPNSKGSRNLELFIFFVVVVVVVVVYGMPSIRETDDFIPFLKFSTTVARRTVDRFSRVRSLFVPYFFSLPPRSAITLCAAPEPSVRLCTHSTRSVYIYISTEKEEEEKPGGMGRRTYPPIDRIYRI